MAPIATSGHSLPYIHLRTSIPWEKEILELIADATTIAREKPFGYEYEIREKLSRLFLVLAKTVRNWNLTIGRIAPRRCNT